MTTIPIFICKCDSHDFTIPFANMNQSVVDLVCHLFDSYFFFKLYSLGKKKKLRYYLWLF